MKDAGTKMVIGAMIAMFVMLAIYSAGMLYEYFTGPHEEPVEFIAPEEIRNTP